MLPSDSIHRVGEDGEDSASVEPDDVREGLVLSSLPQLRTCDLRPRIHQLQKESGITIKITNDDTTIRRKSEHRV